MTLDPTEQSENNCTIIYFNHEQISTTDSGRSSQAEVDESESENESMGIYHSIDSNTSDETVIYTLKQDDDMKANNVHIQGRSPSPSPFLDTRTDAILVSTLNDLPCQTPPSKINRGKIQRCQCKKDGHTGKVGILEQQIISLWKGMNYVIEMISVIRGTNKLKSQTTSSTQTAGPFKPVATSSTKIDFPNPQMTPMKGEPKRGQCLVMPHVKRINDLTNAHITGDINGE
jgi:hypothetical protein